MASTMILHGKSANLALRITVDFAQKVGLFSHLSAPNARPDILLTLISSVRNIARRTAMKIHTTTLLENHASSVPLDSTTIGKQRFARSVQIIALLVQLKMM